MTQREAKKLKHGLYRLYWKEGGASVAAVGMLHDGKYWFAPSNWTSEIKEGIASTKWRMVDRVELIAY